MKHLKKILVMSVCMALIFNVTSAAKGYDSPMVRGILHNDVVED